MPIWPDINGFPEMGFPVLANEQDRVCLGTLYVTPLRPNNFILDILGAVRFGAVTATGIAAGGAITGATTIAASGTVTLSSATAPLTLSGANAVLSMPGINARIGTQFSRVRRGYFTDLDIKNTPTVDNDPVVLQADLARYVPRTGVLGDVDLGAFTMTATGYYSGVSTGLTDSINILDGDGVTTHTLAFTGGIFTGYTTSV